MSDLSFGVHVVPRGPEHGRDLLLRMEDTEFDAAWLADPTITSAAAAENGEPLLDSWVTLGAMANETEEVELGMFVTDLTSRDPVQIARFAMTVDQLSNGRFILGLAADQFESDSFTQRQAAGVSKQEHGDRLQEGAEVLDRILRGDHSPFRGRFTSYESVSTSPGSIQQPRLPILVSGNDQRSIEIAVNHADTWNTWLDKGDLDSLYQQTAERVSLLDATMERAGRNANSLARSLLLRQDSADAWSDDDAIPRIVEQFRPLGFTEFIFSPPRADQMRDFLRIGISVLNTLRD